MTHLKASCKSNLHN